MRRVLVPLDGSDLAASIITDARRLAGPQGTLILVRHAKPPEYGPETDRLDAFSSEDAEEYLSCMADQLQAEGVNVEIHLTAFGDISLAIDEAATAYRADMIACSTHGRTLMGRLIRGGVAWKVLAHSPVPVLVRHAAKQPPAPVPFRRILVPLDQSDFGERALPLAGALQQEWNAGVFLVTVIPDGNPYAPAPTAYMRAYWPEDARASATTYLERAASSLPDAHLRVLEGPPVIQLTEAVRNWHVTDIVMTSHGRTGLGRAVLGSMTDRLIHEVSVPIIVIPSFAMQRAAEDSAAIEPEASVPGV